ncbi:MAG: hypothetical protein HY318_20280 [Armatimonadetes bacterium]|nr:hypothetical protein [Armatimonadota bacterium]
MKTLHATLMVALLSVFCTVPLIAAEDEEKPKLENLVVPQDTKVVLHFADSLTTATARVGDLVNFATAEDIIISGTLVVKKGSAAIGVVTDVRPPRSLGRNAQLRISFQSVRAIDGSLVPLSPYRTPEVDQTTPMAPVASTVGIIALGPIGLVSGAFIQGDHITIKRGATVNAAIARDTVLPAEFDLREVTVPAETGVPLELMRPVSTRTAEVGDIVDFVVRDNVYIEGIVVVTKGTAATGSVKKVKHPRSRGRNGSLQIELVEVKGVDGSLIPLHPYKADKGIDGVNPESPGASVAAGLIFGPVGLIAGAFVKGRHVDVPGGAKVVAAIAKEQRVKGVLPAPK